MLDPVQPGERGLRVAAVKIRVVLLGQPPVGLLDLLVDDGLELLDGLRAHEARYFWTKYQHRFTVVPASKSRPTLDLDSVYGDGPAILDEDSKDAGFYVGARFRIGRNAACACRTLEDVE